MSLLATVGCASRTLSKVRSSAAFSGARHRGAVIGHAVGNTGAGAAIGAGVGALTGAAVGSDMDADKARAQAAAQQNSQAMKATTVQEVVSLAHSNMEEGLIINYVRTHNLAAPLQANDLIYMQQQGVSQNVIAAMQAQPVIAYGAYGAPPPVYVDGGYYYDRPRYYGPPPVGVGISFRGR